MWIVGSAIVTAAVMLYGGKSAARRRAGSMRVQVGGVSERWLAQHRGSRDEHSV
jgi:hypothetical protein